MRFTVLLLFSFMSICLSKQVAAQYSKIGFNLSAGKTMSDIRSRTAELTVQESANQGTITYSGGISVLLAKKPNWGILVEPGFYKAKFHSFGGVSLNGSMSLLSVRVPVQLHYSIPSTPLVLLAGPEIYFPISAKSKIAGTETNSLKDIEDYQAGIAIGFAYQAEENLQFSFSYHHNTSRFSRLQFHDADGELLGSGEAYLRHFSLSIRYLSPF